MILFDIIGYCLYKFKTHDLVISSNVSTFESLKCGIRIIKKIKHQIESKKALSLHQVEGPCGPSS